jgi:hypothetical protein
MTRWSAALVTGLVLVGAHQAAAQGQAPARLEMTAGGGALYFTENDTEPEFHNITMGAAVAYNINRFLGIEGEFAAALGYSQDVRFGGRTNDEATPNMLNYAASVVVALPAGLLRPYASGGIGGLTMLEREEFDVADNQTFLTGNVGGGLKWYAPNGRWGVRGDYRFVMVREKNDAPAFFGNVGRYGHRIYGGVIITAIR